MPKTSRFRGPLDKQHAKRQKALLKSGSQHVYRIHWSLPSQLSLKKSLLFICQILGQLLNTLAADEKYLVLNRDNLTISSQMQLSQKQKTFSQFLTVILKSRLTFEYFEKKMTLIAFVLRKLWSPKTLLDKCLKRPVSEEPSTSKMADVPKHCWNLLHSIFIIFTTHWQVNWLRKGVSSWHAQSWDGF